MATQHWKVRNASFQQIVAGDAIFGTFLQVLPFDLLNSISEVLESDFEEHIFDATNYDYSRSITWKNQDLQLHIMDYAAVDPYFFGSLIVVLIVDATSETNFEKYVEVSIATFYGETHAMQEEWDRLLRAPFKGRPEVRGRRPLAVMISKCDLVNAQRLQELQKGAKKLVETFGNEISIHFVSAVRARGIEEAIPIVLANQLRYDKPVRERPKKRRRNILILSVMIVVWTIILIVVIVMTTILPVDVDDR